MPSFTNIHTWSFTCFFVWMILLNIMVNNLGYAQRIKVPTTQKAAHTKQHARSPVSHTPQMKPGLWVPITQINPEISIIKLQKDGQQRLYAFGGGRSFMDKAPYQSEEIDWYEIQGYAPQLVWTEGEKIEATGPFDAETLDRVEGEVTTLIEDQVDQQQDENFLSEDVAQSIIEQYVNETYPAQDSPYLLHHTLPYQQGILLKSGVGLWHISKQKIQAITPTVPTTSITHDTQVIWMSNEQGIFYKPFISSSRPASTLGQVEWIQLSNHAHAQLVHDGKRLWFVYKNGLYYSQSFARPQKVHVFGESVQKLYYAGQRLWVSTAQKLMQSSPIADTDYRPQWSTCVRYPYRSRSLHFDQVLLNQVNTVKRIVTTLDDRVYLTHVDHDQCKATDVFVASRDQTLALYDAIWHKKQLYVATQRGLFTWYSHMSNYQQGIKYYQKAIQTYPRFDQIYRAALQVNQLDPQANPYGKRPILSALLPQLRLRFQTHPQRNDNVPTFADGSRRLTLHQPRPEYQIFAEWKLSFDFLATLIDPSRASTIVDLQNQMQNIMEQPGSNLALEEALDVDISDFDQDSYNAQAQRLAMTTIAVEKRQMQKDRATLYRTIARLYRERFNTLFRLMTSNPRHKKSKKNKRRLDSLRVQEIDALLDALTNYQLKMTDKAAPSLQYIDILSTQ